MYLFKEAVWNYFPFIHIKISFTVAPCTELVGLDLHINQDLNCKDLDQK